MTNEAERLMAEALKRVNLGGSFDPADVGARIGLSKPQAEAAARALSNAGVLVLGFDLAAHFSPAFRKIHKPAINETPGKAKSAKSSRSIAPIKSAKKRAKVAV